MSVFDKRLIGPTEAELVRALGQAMKAANRDNSYHNNQMTRDAEFWGRFARDVLRGGPEGRRRSCKGGRAVPEVITGWWTDPAGRKHVRVVGRTRRRWSQLRRETDLRELPPWWHVYPEAILGVRQKKEGERYLAACRCGAVGSPGSLGWMGDTCGPCFDRRAEGGTASGGFGQFSGWAPGMSRFGFTADGRHLVAQRIGGAFQKVSRDDGSAVTARRKTSNSLVATASDAGGVTMVTQEGTVYHWAEGAADVAVVVAGRKCWGRVALTPDARRAALLAYQDAFTADLTEPRPRWAPHPPPNGLYAIQYAPDGSRLLATSVTGEVVEVNPDTMATAVVRGDLFAAEPPWSGPPPELAVSADGASVLVRRESYYPRRVAVRHVPLAGGKVTELRLPEWHRATTFGYSPDGKFAVTAESEGGWVGFFEIASGKSLGFVRAVLEDLSWRSGQIEFSPDGRAVAVSYNTGHSDHGSTIAVWPWPDVVLAAGA